MKPVISLVIVNYRSADVLEHCLRSIHAATDQTVEVILVDNSPATGAEQVLLRSGLPGYYFPQADNIGYTRAANFGARHAAGDYLCFLNPDMVLGPQSLDRLRDWVGQHPRTVAGPRELDAKGKAQTSVFPYVTRRYIWGANTIHKIPWPRPIHPLLPWLTPSYRYAHVCRNANKPRRVPVLSGSCLMLAKSIWQEVGEFEEELTYFGLESEWFELARDGGVTAWYIPAATVYHEHAVSIRRADTGAVSAEATANRRWYAQKKGWAAIAGLGIMLWVEEKIRRRSD